MTKPNDGGAAFPGEQGYTPQGWNQTWDPGMTLRDWFAGQAISGMLGTNFTWKEASEYAYEFADAMLAARDKKAEGTAQLNVDAFGTIQP